MVSTRVKTFVNAFVNRISSFKTWLVERTVFFCNQHNTITGDTNSFVWLLAFDSFFPKCKFFWNAYQCKCETNESSYIKSSQLIHMFIISVILKVESYWNTAILQLHVLYLYTMFSAFFLLLELKRKKTTNKFQQFYTCGISFEAFVSTFHCFCLFKMILNVYLTLTHSTLHKHTPHIKYCCWLDLKKKKK